MSVVAAALLVTALWLALAAVLGGCGACLSSAARSEAADDHRWLWEPSDRPARLARDARLPASHPLARLRRAG
jgi:hypothetical protein